MAKSVKAKELDAHIFEKDPRGHYVDERWCSARLFEVLGLPMDYTVYDPACGWGRITHSANAIGYKTLGSDIVNRRRHELDKRFVKRDFLKEKFTVPAKCAIVCNPPFDQVQEFCEKACWLVDEVAMITLVRRLPAAGRWLNELPLSAILFMSPRPSMPTGEFIRRVERGEIDKKTKQPLKVGGGTQDFCWLIFRRGMRSFPSAMWLYRDA